MNIKAISKISTKYSKISFGKELHNRKTTFAPVTKESLTYSAQEKRIIKQGFLYSLALLSVAIGYFKVIKK